MGDVSPPHIARAIAGLWRNQSVIGPGGACTRAATEFLRTGDWTTCGAPPGQAGNGTAMRTAALGLFFLREPDRLPAAVADISRITHRDPRSIAGGVAVAKAAQFLASEPVIAPRPFCEAVAGVMDPYEPTFAELIRRLPDLVEQPPEQAFPALAWAGMAWPEFDAPIITPFVIPTVLAALWCLLRHPDSWPRAVAGAVRLGGDVDTLGAIAGALAGARLGLAAIPRHLWEAVQQRDRIHDLAVRYHAVAMRSDCR